MVVVVPDGAVPPFRRRWLPNGRVALLQTSPSFECRHVVGTQLEPLAVDSLVGKSSVPVSLHTFWVVRFDHVNLPGLKRELNRKLSPPPAERVCPANFVSGAGTLQ